MKIYKRPFSPTLKLSKTFKRMISSTLDRNIARHFKMMCLDAETSFINVRSFVKPERQPEGD